MWVLRAVCGVVQAALMCSLSMLLLYTSLWVDPLCEGPTPRGLPVLLDAAAAARCCAAAHCGWVGACRPGAPQAAASSRC